MMKVRFIDTSRLHVVRRDRAAQRDIAAHQETAVPAPQHPALDPGPPARYAGFVTLICTDAPALSSSVPRVTMSSPGFRSPNTSTSSPDVRPVLTSTHSVRPL